MKTSIHITHAEWEVLSVVWERAPVAASTVAEVLEERRRWTLTTVRTLLRRLVNKRMLEQRLDGKRYLYSPLVSAEECVRRESESFLDRVLGRAPSTALIHIVRNAELSKKDINELRRILRQKEGKP